LKLTAAHPVTAALLLVLLATAIFLAFPQIDIWFSQLFYRSRGGFWLRKNDVLGFFRGTNDVLIAAIVVVLIAAIAAKLARPGKPTPIAPNIVVYLLSSLILGPLLLVNVILKNNWGRPRPVQVDLFGGNAPYIEVWQITDWCDRNCSFVSGEASSAIWLVAVALLLPKPVRLPATVLAGAYAILLSLNRIAFGGHFLSDVVLSFGLTLLLIAVLHRVVIAQPPAWLSNAILDAGLTRIGAALRGHRGGTT
jgi:lipid A 4'-phosphatase